MVTNLKRFSTADSLILGAKGNDLDNLLQKTLVTCLWAQNVIAIDERYRFESCAVGQPFLRLK